MEIDRHILIRYFSGECSGEEKEYIRQWLEYDEAHKKQFIHERIRFDASVIVDEDQVLVSSKPVKPIYWNLLKIASAILLLIGCSYLFSIYQVDKLNLSSQQIYVPPGSRTSLTLPDGTSVWLNANTKLNYPNLFSKKQRIVELDGEAFFEVAEDREKPFIVKTSKYNVEVLGTSFNLEAYSNQSDFEMALFTGKVKIYKETNKDLPLYLNAGNTASLVDGQLVLSATNFNNYRWREGLIVIEGESFDQIMQLFEKYFDLQIIIQNNQVKNLGYRGKLRIADGVDHALRVLQNDFHFTYKREENTNIIYIQ